MTEDIEGICAWLISWFRKQRPELDQQPDTQILAADYFASEFIDSMGVVELIGEAESVFGIRFTESDFQDRRFSSVAGLAAIISERSRETR